MHIMLYQLYHVRNKDHIYIYVNIFIYYLYLYLYIYYMNIFICTHVWYLPLCKLYKCFDL